MSKYSFAALILLLATVAALVYLASQGVIVAAVGVGVIIAVLLIGLGVVLTLLASWAGAKREQATFTANARENLALINAMQTVQNRQNAMLLRQGCSVDLAQRSLPGGDGLAADALTVDAGLFDELDE